MINSNYKTAIVLHLYYVDLWEEFAVKLKQTDINFDLYVTICESEGQFADNILLDFPNAKVLKVKNKGLDIGPFLLVLKHLMENNIPYKYLIKLHAKKSLHHGQPIEFGHEWRNTLVDKLIGNTLETQKLLDYMDCNTDYKLAGAARHIHIESDTTWMQDLLDALGVDISLIKGPNFFIAGTMFLIDYDFLINFFSQIEIDVLYNLMADGYFKEHEKSPIEHKMERILGFIILEKGYKIHALY